MEFKRKPLIIALAVAMTGLLPFATSSPAQAISADYERIATINTNAKVADGKIFHEKKKLDNRDFHVTRAIIDTSPDHVWTYLTDLNKAPQVFSNLKKARLVDQKDNRKKIEFQVASLGGLVKYDYVLHVVEEKPYEMEWSRASGAFKRNDGFWSLKPLDGGKRTLVTYGKHIDGGLFVPQMIVDKQLKGIMPEVITNIRSAVANDRKRIASKP